MVASCTRYPFTRAAQGRRQGWVRRLWVMPEEANEAEEQEKTGRCAGPERRGALQHV